MEGSGNKGIASYRTFNEVLNEVAERYPDKTAVESIDDARSITFRKFCESCNKFAHYLESIKINAGDRMVLIGPNSIEWLIIFFGILKYGSVVIPLNTQYTEAEMEKLINRIDPRLVFYDRKIESLLPLEKVGESIPFATWDKCTNNDLFFLTSSFSASSFQHTPAEKDAIGLMNLTSGTTAAPKCVVYTNANYYYSILSFAERLGINENDRFLEYRSFTWLSPQIVSVGPSFFTGATLVITQKFSQSRFFEWLKEFKVTVAAGVPTVLNMLLARPVDTDTTQFEGFRFMTSSSAPLTIEQQKKFREKYELPIVQLMGISEGGGIACNFPENPRVGSVGQPVKYICVRIVDENGKDVAIKSEGELVIGGLQLAKGYLNEKGDLESVSSDGWFRTGDLGFLNEEGYLYITGRKKSIIIRGGVNVSPIEVNDALLSHPAVAEAETIGVPDDIYGEQVVSFVKLKTGEKQAGEELIQHCQRRLSELKVPKECIVVEEIPKSDRMKSDKAQLLKIYESR